MQIAMTVTYVQSVAGLVALKSAMSDRLRLASADHDLTQCTFINALCFKRLARKRLGQLETNKLMQLSLIGCAVSAAAVHDTRYTS